MAEVDMVDQVAGEPGEDAAARSRRPLWKRLLFGAFVTFAVLLFVAATLYSFGSMWPPSREARAAYDQLVAQGQAPPVPAYRFHIPIPGCVCHSADPVRQIEHANRRISECVGCHGGG